MPPRKKVNDDSEESPYQTIRRLLSESDKNLQNNLKKYELVDLHGFFISIAFLLSISLGIIGSFYFFPSGTSFYIAIIILSALSAVLVMILISSVFVHIYNDLFSNKKMIRIVLSYQSITMFISIILSFVIMSPLPLYSGLFLFGVLLFVNPALKILYKNQSTTQEFNTTIKKIYDVITVIINILNPLIHYLHSMKLIPGL